MDSFKQLQYQFAKAVKDPQNVSQIPGVEPERLQVYQRLIHNTISGFIDSAFPVLKSIYDEKNWSALKRDFVAKHRSVKPLFCQISAEFIEFVEQEYELTPTDPIFLKELAHYEWLELEMASRSRDTNQVALTEIESDDIYFSNLAELVSYPFAVHQISKTQQPDKAQTEPCYLLVYRDFNDKVNFLSINLMTAYLIELIKNHSANQFSQIFEQMQIVMPQLDKDQLKQGLFSSLRELADKSVLIGRK